MGDVAVPMENTDCSFCGHGKEQHRFGRCTAATCADPPNTNEYGGQGRCAVYTSWKDKRRNDLYSSLIDVPVTLTAQDLANTIHRRQHGGGEHSMVLSCGCMRSAMFLLHDWDFNDK